MGTDIFGNAWNPQSEGIEDEATMQEPDTTLGITEQGI